MRERVAEHMNKLKNGNIGSFQINHWLEKHHTSIYAPEFKWSVLDKYKDALRRQLCEGLYILESGSLNKNLEFNRNIICRLDVTMDTQWSDKQLKLEMNDRRLYNIKLRCFVDKMSILSDDIKLAKGGRLYLQGQHLLKNHSLPDIPFKHYSSKEKGSTAKWKLGLQLVNTDR